MFELVGYLGGFIGNPGVQNSETSDSFPGFSALDQFLNALFSRTSPSGKDGEPTLDVDKDFDPKHVSYPSLKPTDSTTAP
jgi:hypothetical protein